MPPRPSRATRELLALYARAGRDEYNIGAFLRERPELVAHLGVPLDLERDDADLALQLAPAVGRYKRRAAHLRTGEQEQRTAAAVRQMIASARRRADGIELDADVLLGDLLADNRKKYICFELPSARVPIFRRDLAKARGALRMFIDVAASVDDRGLHLRWRAGRGGLNFRPQVEEREAEVLHVDLRPAPPVRRTLPRPVRLADVLAELGLS